MWRIEMFGGFYVSHNNQPISDFPTQKDAALLAYLAYFSPMRQTREQLAEIFWANAKTSKHSRQSLRQAITSLGKIKNNDEIQLLGKDKTALWLESGMFVTDVIEFRGLLKTAKRANTDEGRIAALEQAVDLYVGDFLPGVYEDWAQSERNILRADYDLALEELVELLERNGDLRHAEKYKGRIKAEEYLDSPLKSRMIYQGKSAVTPFQENSIGLEEVEQGAEEGSSSSSPSIEFQKIVAQTSQAEKPTKKTVSKKWLMIGGVLLVIGGTILGWKVRPPNPKPHFTSTQEHTPASVKSFEALLRLLESYRENPIVAETSGERNKRQQRHATVLREIAEMAWNAWYGPEEHLWIIRLKPLEPDLHSAFVWSLENDIEGALQLCGTLTRYELLAQQPADIKYWMEQALAKGSANRSVFKARVLTGSSLNLLADAPQRAGARLEEAFEIYHRAGNAWGEAHVRRHQGLVKNAQQDHAETYRLFMDATHRFRALQDERGVALSLYTACMLNAPRSQEDDLPMIKSEWSQESLKLFRKIGNDWGIERAMAEHEKQVSLLFTQPRQRDPKKVREFAQSLLQEYSNQAVRQHEGGIFPKELHRKRLQLAHKLSDKRAMLEEIYWLVRFVPPHSPQAERWCARLVGFCFQNVTSCTPPPISTTELNEVSQNIRNLLPERKQEHLLDVEIAKGRVLAVDKAVAEALKL